MEFVVIIMPLGVTFVLAAICKVQMTVTRTSKTPEILFGNRLSKNTKICWDNFCAESKTTAWRL